MLPYGKQTIDTTDIRAVLEVLESDWLTTGPAIELFENQLAGAVRAPHAVAVNSGTAALHAALAALGVGPGDEVIVPTFTFAATANAAVYQGATPVFVDVDPDTLLVDPAAVEQHLTSRTRAIMAVDFAGQPCDYARLSQLAHDHGVPLVADACHSLGATYRQAPVGTLADITCFSFHPVKLITTAEGGMAVTGDQELASRMRRFRNHGITTDFRQRRAAGTWRYEMTSLGFNYRLSDLHSALGVSQLARLDQFVARRHQIAAQYRAGLAPLGLQLVEQKPDRTSAHHLFVVRFGPPATLDRDTAFSLLRARGVGANVHYPPVHLHPFYRAEFGTDVGCCPVAERAAGEVLSLPIFPRMTDAETRFVIDSIREIVTPVSTRVA